MEFRTLGSLDIRVPVLGMGAWSGFDVYGKHDQAARRDLVTNALDLGVRLFETSPKFGEAERILGTTLVGRRERAFVATNVWSHNVTEGHAQIDRALHFFDGSIDLYLVQEPIGQQHFLPVFERMKVSGSIRASGVGVSDTRCTAELLNMMRLGSIDAIQVPYHAGATVAERNLLPAAAALGIAVLAIHPPEDDVFVSPPPHDAIRQFRAFGCTTWPQILLKWTLSDARVTAVIHEINTLAALRELAAAAGPPWFGAAERDEVRALIRRYCSGR